MVIIDQAGWIDFYVVPYMHTNSYTLVRVWVCNVRKFTDCEKEYTLKNEKMAWRFCLYSGRGTCCQAEHLSGRQASLAPKNTVTANGCAPPSPPLSTGGSKTLSTTFNAHLVLYPLYPLNTTSTWKIKEPPRIFNNTNKETKGTKRVKNFNTVREKIWAREAPQPPSSKDSSVIESPKR